MWFFLSLISCCGHTSPMTISLTFDPIEHAYTMNGASVPSVTQVLRETGLLDASHYTAESRVRGTVVHKITELLDKGRLKESSIDPRVAGYVDGYRKYLRDMEPEFLGVEEVVGNEEFRYAGTLDRRIRIRGTLYVKDLKTGDPQQWHRWQLSAYQKCLQSPLSYRRMNLYLSDGDYRQEVFPAKDDLNDWGVFQSARITWEHQVRRIDG